MTLAEEYVDTQPSKTPRTEAFDIKEQQEMPHRNGSTQATEGRDIGAMVERARTQVEDVAERAKSTLTTVDRTLTAKMRENPLLVLGAAVGIGYVIGRIFSRIR